MTDRVLHRVFCERPGPRKWHTLARVYVDRVEYRAALHYPNGVGVTWRTITRADIADVEELSVDAFCPCGDSFLINVSELLQFRKARAVRMSDSGVPESQRRLYRRRRG